MYRWTPPKHSSQLHRRVPKKCWRDLTAGSLRDRDANPTAKGKASSGRPWRLPLRGTAGQLMPYCFNGTKRHPWCMRVLAFAAIVACAGLASCRPNPEAGGGIGGTGSVSASSVSSGAVTKLSSVNIPAQNTHTQMPSTVLMGSRAARRTA